MTILGSIGTDPTCSHDGSDDHEPTFQKWEIVTGITLLALIFIALGVAIVFDKQDASLPKPAPNAQVVRK